MATTLYLTDQTPDSWNNKPVVRRSTATISSGHYLTNQSGGGQDDGTNWYPCLMMADYKDDAQATKPNSITKNTAYYGWCKMFVSRPLYGNQTIGGVGNTFTISAGYTEGASTNDMVPRVLIYVMNGTDRTVRGTLFAEANSATEADTTAANQQTFWSGTALSSVNALDGDYIVLECLYYEYPTSTKSNSVHAFDFGGSSAGYRSYLQFSQTLAFKRKKVLSDGVRFREATGSGYSAFKKKLVRRMHTSSGLTAERFRVSDTIRRKTTFRKKLVEQARFKDTHRYTGKWVKKFYEQVRVKDTITKTSKFLRKFVDQTRFSDVMSKKTSYIRNFSDEVRFKDTISSQSYFRMSFAEQLRVSETIATTSNFLRQLIDQVRFLETITVTKTGGGPTDWSKKFTEALRVSDVFTKKADFIRAYSDQARFSDETSHQADFRKAFSEQSRFSESHAKSFIKVLIDQVRFSDVMTGRSSFIRRFYDQARFSESASHLSSFVVALTEQARFSESYSLAGSQWVRSFSEQLRVSESTLKHFIKLVSDAAEFLDSITLGGLPQTWSKKFSEKLRVRETVTTRSDFVARLSEGTQFSDNIVRDLRKVLSDGAQFAENTIKSFKKSMVEGARFKDTSTRIHGIILRLIDRMRFKETSTVSTISITSIDSNMSWLGSFRRPLLSAPVIIKILSGSNPISGAAVTITITNPVTGRTWYTGTMTESSTSAGVYRCYIRTRMTDPLGSYPTYIFASYAGRHAAFYGYISVFQELTDSIWYP